MDLYDIRRELNNGRVIYDIPMRITYYARVSTDKEEQAHSLKNQVEYYNDYIKRNPCWTYIEGYVDEGLSGTGVEKRGSFLRMLEDARAGKFDFLITKEISRFSRNTLDSIKYTQELLICGVGVLFQSDNINTLLPDSELRLAIMAGIAQDEVRKISERVKFGFRRAVENGVVLGNSGIWGYVKQDGRLVVDEEQAWVVSLIFELYAAQSMGIRAISACLAERGHLNSKGNPLSFSTIKGILTNPKYKGYYCGNKTHKLDYRSPSRKVFDKEDWVMYQDEENVPPIVSGELWEKANAILNKRSEKMSSQDRTSYQNKYSYSGKIVCAEHGVFYYRALYRYKSGDREVWQCKKYSEKGAAGCASPAVYTAELDMIAREYFGKIIKDKSEIADSLIKIYSSVSQKSPVKKDIARLLLEIDEIRRRKDKLLDLSVKGKLSDDEFEARNEQFNMDIEDIKNKISILERQELDEADIARPAEALRQIIAEELDFGDGFNNSIIDCLLEKIEVYKTDVKNIIAVRAYFRVFSGSLDYTISRNKKNTSVCCAPYI